jgi:hypothetical protein
MLLKMKRVSQLALFAPSMDRPSRFNVEREDRLCCWSSLKSLSGGHCKEKPPLGGFSVSVVG